MVEVAAFAVERRWARYNLNLESEIGMRPVQSVITVVLLFSCARPREYAPDAILPEILVGEWVTSGSEFTGQVIAKGGALYLYRDGTAAVIAAPPPTAITGTASYVKDELRLNIRLIERGRIRGNIYLRYDPVSKELRNIGAARETQGTYTRRQAVVPDTITVVLRNRDRMP